MISLWTRARICRSFKETRYRFSSWRAGTKTYLSYWPARLHRLAKSIPRNRFLGSINVYKYGLRQTDGKNLFWFGEIERNLAKLAMPTCTYILPHNYFMPWRLGVIKSRESNSVSDPDWLSRSGSRRGKNDSQKIEKFLKCSMFVLLWGLKAFPVAWTSLMEA